VLAERPRKRDRAAGGADVAVGLRARAADCDCHRPRRAVAVRFRARPRERYRPGGGIGVSRRRRVASDDARRLDDDWLLRRRAGVASAAGDAEATADRIADAPVAGLDERAREPDDPGNWDRHRGRDALDDVFLWLAAAEDRHRLAHGKRENAR